MIRDKMLARLKEKMGESKMSDSYKKAKKGMLQSLAGEMSGMAAEPLKGMKKVSVMSDSEQGLHKGLDKAKQLLEDKEEASEDPREEALESADDEKREQEADSQYSDHDNSEMEDGGMSQDNLADIEKQIADLMHKKAKMHGK